MHNPRRFLRASQRACQLFAALGSRKGLHWRLKAGY
jgi:hypothetical protein